MKASTVQAVKQVIMTTEQANIIETIIQIGTEAARVAVQAMAIASVENNQRAQNVGPKLGGLLMRQLTFHCRFTDNYAEKRSFRVDVKNMFQNYSISQAERVPIIKNG